MYASHKICALYDETRRDIVVVVSTKGLAAKCAIARFLLTERTQHGLYPK